MECKDCGHRRGYHIQRGRPSKCTIFNCGCKAYAPAEPAGKVELCKTCKGRGKQTGFPHDMKCPDCDGKDHRPKADDSRPEYVEVFLSEPRTEMSPIRYSVKKYIYTLEARLKETQEERDKLLKLAQEFEIHAERWQKIAESAGALKDSE